MNVELEFLDASRANVQTADSVGVTQLSAIMRERDVIQARVHDCGSYIADEMRPAVGNAGKCRDDATVSDVHMLREQRETHEDFYRFSDGVLHLMNCRN